MGALLAGAVAVGPGIGTAAAAPMATFYVSPSGSDANSGSSAAEPFATIAKARDAVRALLAQEERLTRDIVVKVRAGDYFLSSPIQLDERDSGRNGHQVIYENYDERAESEAPTIYGGTRITGWSPTSSNANIYQAKVPGGSAFHNLTEGDTMAAPAATSLSGVTAPGQWYLDTSANTVYYWPHSQSIATSVIVAPKVQDIFRIVGSAQTTPAHDITITGLTLNTTDFVASFSTPPGDNLQYEANKHGLVYGENVKNITVSHSRLLNAGLSAVWFNKFAQNNTVSGNWIDRTGLNGVYLTGWNIGTGPFTDPAAAYVNKSNLVTNNFIHDVGRFEGLTAGIQMYQSGDNTISHNRIIGSPRYGISQKGSRYGVMASSYYGHAVTRANHNDFLYTRNNLLEANDISDVVKSTSDAGAIESWGIGQGTVIKNNRIHDMRADSDWNTWFGGIYLDDGSDDVTVTGNIIHNVVGGIRTFPIYEKGINNTISNNILADNQAHWDMRLEAFAEPSYGLTLTNNIFYRNKAAFAYDPMDLPGGWRGLPEYGPVLTGEIPNRLASVDNNLFYDPTGSFNVNVGSASLSFADYQSRYARAYDQHSVTGVDPQFVNPDGHDYTLQPDSPALALGFTNIDQKSIGLRPTFPFDVSELTLSSPASATAGHPTTVTEVFTNHGGRPVQKVHLSLTAPDGFTVRATSPAVTASVPAGGTARTTFEVTPPASTHLFKTDTLNATATYQRRGAASEKVSTATFTFGQPVKDPYQTFASTTASMSQAGSRLGIRTQGRDVWEDTNEYGAIYQHGAEHDGSTTIVKVDSQTNTSTWAKSGIMVRNDITNANASPGYVILAATPGQGYALQYDANGDGKLESNRNLGTTVYPGWLKLVRSGTTFTGYYSTDGTQWTQIASANVPSAAATQDVGVFSTNGTPGTTGEADFDSFTTS